MYKIENADYIGNKVRTYKNNIIKQNIFKYLIFQLTLYILKIQIYIYQN